MEENEAKRLVESITDNIACGEKKEGEGCTKQIVEKVVLTIGSLKETEFDTWFTPDVFSSSGATLADAINNRSINMLYLDKSREMLAKVPQLEYVHVILVS